MSGFSSALIITHISSCYTYLGNMTETKNLEAYQALLQVNEQEASLKARRGYLKAYLLSVLLPPIGVFYFIKYFFFADTTSDNRKAAVISLSLTVVSLILSIWLFQLFFNQFAPKNSQNMNFMQDLITPENQKTLRQLMQ